MCMGGLGFLSLSSIVLSAVFIWNGVFSLWNETCNVYVCLNHTKSDSDQEHAILPTIYKRCTTKMNLSIILSPKCNHKHKSNAVEIDLWCILSRCRQPHGFNPLQKKLKGEKPDITFMVSITSSCFLFKNWALVFGNSCNIIIIRQAFSFQFFPYH